MTKNVMQMTTDLQKIVAFCYESMDEKEIVKYSTQYDKGLERIACLKTGNLDLIDADALKERIDYFITQECSKEYSLDDLRIEYIGKAILILKNTISLHTASISIDTRPYMITHAKKSEALHFNECKAEIERVIEEFSEENAQ